MFELDNQTDGFFYQIDYVSKILTGDFDVNALFFIHVARLIIVAPFYFVYLLKLPSAADAIIYLVYLSPLLVRRGGWRVPVQMFFIFLPVFFSYRASLGMCAMGYLYLILFKNVNSYSLFTISALLANLSSGVVLSWVCVVFFSMRHIFREYMLFIPVFLFLVVGFSMSLIHKIGYMFKAEGVAQHGSAIERSTIYVSFIHEQYSRLFIYLTIALFLYFILGLRLVRNYSNRMFLFFLAAVPGVFLEGIGLISYLMCFTFLVNDLFTIKRREVQI